MKKVISLNISAIFLMFVANSYCNPSDQSVTNRPPATGDIALAPPFPTFEQMIGISPVVFTGIVSGIRYGKHSHSPYPFTFVKFAGVDFLRGAEQAPKNEDKTIEISYVGGLTDDLTRLEVSEFPDFELGERYLVFLRGGGWNLSPITANSKGVLRLYGGLKEDPVLLSLEGEPVAGINTEGEVIFASKKESKQGRHQRDTLSKEKKMNAKKEERYKNLSERMKDRKRLERAEETQRRKQLMEETEKKSREEDQSDAFLAQYERVLRLSEFRLLIERIAKQSAGKYSKFETLYLVPIAKQGDGSLKPATPTTK